ncbi:MAG: helix-turn-helix domain-containing protein [Clostridia bacterium]|nr:helix-turn-helix domain-containing protein [Clostridia bacterium]
MDLNTNSVQIVHQFFAFDIVILHCGVQTNPHHRISSISLPRSVINIVLEGTWDFILQGKHFTLQKNDLFFIPRNATYSQKCLSSTPGKYIYIAFLGNNCESLMDKAGFSVDHPVITPSDPDFFYGKFTKIYDLLKKNSFISIFNAVLTFGDMLNHLFLLNHENNQPLKHNLEQFVNEAQQYIINNYSSNICANDVCKYLHISYSYFNKIFKNSTNYSIKRFITKCKIDEAKNLLANSDLSISDIAYKVGYIDYADFYRQFITDTEQSPKEFRKSHRQS